MASRRCRFSGLASLGDNNAFPGTVAGVTGTYATVPSAYKYFGIVAETRPMREVKLGETWYQQVVHIVPNSDRCRSFVIDITDRKRIEEALEQQN